MRYEVQPDGKLAAGRVFFDMASAKGEEALDGIKVDQAGNLYVSGPGGIWIIALEGKHIGIIEAPELPANLAWGDEDGRILFMTARRPHEPVSREAEHSGDPALMQLHPCRGAASCFHRGEAAQMRPEQLSSPAQP